MWERIVSHSPQGIHAGAARAAHARAAVRAADDAVAGLRLRGEPGRGPRAHRVDGSGPHAGEPRPARPLHRLRPLRDRGHAGQRAARCSACSTAARRRRWCACCPASRAIWRAAVPPQVQVLVDGTNSNTASIVSSYAGGVIAAFSAEQLAAAAERASDGARRGGSGERGGSARDRGAAASGSTPI